MLKPVPDLFGSHPLPRLSSRNFSAKEQLFMFLVNPRISVPDCTVNEKRYLGIRQVKIMIPILNRIRKLIFIKGNSQG
jgi:hypothetical protein